MLYYSEARATKQVREPLIEVEPPTPERPNMIPDPPRQEVTQHQHGADLREVLLQTSWKSLLVPSTLVLLILLAVILTAILSR